MTAVDMEKRVHAVARAAVFAVLAAFVSGCPSKKEEPPKPETPEPEATESEAPEKENAPGSRDYFEEFFGKR